MSNRFHHGGLSGGNGNAHARVTHGANFSTPAPTSAESVCNSAAGQARLISHSAGTRCTRVPEKAQVHDDDLPRLLGALQKIRRRPGCHAVVLPQAHGRDDEKTPIF